MTQSAEQVPAEIKIVGKKIRCESFERRFNSFLENLVIMGKKKDKNMRHNDALTGSSYLGMCLLFLAVGNHFMFLSTEDHTFMTGYCHLSHRVSQCDPNSL